MKDRLIFRTHFKTSSGPAGPVSSPSPGSPRPACGTAVWRGGPCRRATRRPTERGVALLIVLSSLMLLSALVVEFAYETNVTYNISMNERERLQAYYLAQSALNFSKIMIKYNMEAQQMVAKAAQKLGRNIRVQPLYKMIPVNSAVLRGFIQSATSEEGAPPPPENPEDTKKGLSTSPPVASTLTAKEAESFLSFEGDFLADIDAQDGKFPLNAFYLLNPSQPEYDRLKNILIFLFMQKAFEGKLKDRIRESQELATKIADFIDRNDAINEFGGNERGSEASVYGGTSQKPKNAKLFTVEELILIPGITDDILTELKKYVTVYKSDYKINACLASEELLRAMIIAFTQNRNDMEPLRPDNKDRLKNAVKKVLAKCPQTSEMSQALNEALGVTAPTSAPPPPSSGVAPPSTGGSFATMITADETIFQIEATGTVGNAEVKITQVINAQGGNPDRWKNLYWRVE